MKKGRIMRFLFITASAYIIIAYFVSCISGLNRYDEYILDDYINVKIVHEDEKVDIYNSNVFPVVDKNDVLYVSVHLPQEKYMKNSSLCFSVYNSIITVYYKDDVLYTYGREEADKGRQIGNVFASAPIPEEAWGKDLTIKCEVKENKCYSKIYNVKVIESNDAAKYFLINHEVDFMMFVTILILAIVICIFIVFNNKWSLLYREGIYISSFCICVSLWILGYDGMINIISNVIPFCANIEYIALFFGAIPLSLYFFEQESNKRLRIIQGIASGIFIVFFIVTTILNFTTVNYHYSRFLTILHILIFLIIGITFYIRLKYRNEENISELIFRYGMSTLLVILTLEIIRFYVDKYIKINTNVFSNTLTTGGLFIFVITIISSHGVRIAAHYITEKDKENLERMAYTDITTGILNRAGSYRELKKLDNEEEYALVFLDLNDLKLANDKYGHKIGDKLIKYVADILKVIFNKNGFCARHGGDEFIAGIYKHSGNEIYRSMETFDKRIKEGNDQKLFPFEVSVAYGITVIKSESDITVDEALKKADNNMYKNKMEYKSRRA